MKPMSLAHFYGLSFILGGIFGVGFFMGEAFGLWSMQTYLDAYFIFILGMFVLALPYSFWWWHKADEAVKEAHKWAWFWGGSFGMVAAIVLAIFDYLLALNMETALIEVMGLQGLTFIAGIIFTILPMFIGYGLAWVVWWARHR